VAAVLLDDRALRLTCGLSCALIGALALARLSGLIGPPRDRGAR
jgi:hypothetical protein